MSTAIWRYAAVGVVCLGSGLGAGWVASGHKSCGRTGYQTASAGSLTTVVSGKTGRVYLIDTGGIRLVGNISDLDAKPMQLGEVAAFATKK